MWDCDFHLFILIPVFLGFFIAWSSCCFEAGQWRHWPTHLVTYIHWNFSKFSDIVLRPQKVRNPKTYYYTVTVRDREPRTATSTLTQLLSSDIQQTGPATLTFDFRQLLLQLGWYSFLVTHVRLWFSSFRTHFCVSLFLNCVTNFSVLHLYLLFC